MPFSLFAALLACFASAAHIPAGSPQEDLRLHDALAARQVFRASLELAATCRNLPLPAPGWCPKPEQPVVAPDGGLTVTPGEDVELELSVPLMFAVGRHAFMIVSLESLRLPDLKPAFGTVVDFGVPGVQLLKFRADRPGEYVFYEPYSKTTTGRFTVGP
ncbi:MAG: hypothetical protein HY925_10060 [Elusimicrobia bacterium]|nr:hypothetical protein [Elusimicrobiota bacterium]